MNDYGPGHPLWTARKAALIRFRGYRCERCGDDEPRWLEMHHRTYARYGRERPEDVELLCPHCHDREHNRTRTRTIDLPQPIGASVVALMERIAE